MSFIIRRSTKTVKSCCRPKKKKYVPKDVWENSGHILSQCNQLLEINIRKKKSKIISLGKIWIFKIHFELKKDDRIYGK